jgi:hypothetical protein
MACFKSRMAELIAERLRDPAEDCEARVFPYQLMVAYALAVETRDSGRGGKALQDAMEIATRKRSGSFGKGLCVSRISRSRCIRR